MANHAKPIKIPGTFLDAVERLINTPAIKKARQRRREPTIKKNGRRKKSR